jgi:hypothetical protein
MSPFRRAVALVLGMLALVVPLLGCATLNPEYPHPIEGVDYGVAPTDDDLRMVSRDIGAWYDLEMTGHCKEEFGPIRGSTVMSRDGKTETVFGYEYHCRWTNDDHYMVFIRDGEIVKYEHCGKIEQLLALLSRPSC